MIPDDRTMNRLTVGLRWAAAHSCIEPMTLNSLIADEWPTVSITDVAACTIVSTPAWSMILAMLIRRMSVRMNSARPNRRCMSFDGTSESTAITRSMAGFWASRVVR